MLIFVRTCSCWIGTFRIFHFRYDHINIDAFQSLQKDREFVLEKAEQCQPKLSSYIMIFDIQKTLMMNNTLRVVGSCDVSESLSNSMAVILRYKRCQMTGNDCSKEFDFPIPSFCLLMSTKTPFGDSLGKFITPKITCPIKTGHYWVNLSIPLTSVIDIPSSRIRYRIKFLFMDARRKNSVGCVELISWVKQLPPKTHIKSG